MAAIDAALQQPLKVGGNAAGGNTSVTTPHVAPGVTTPTPITSQGKLTADEKRYIDVQRQAQTDIERQAEKDATQQQERESAFDRSANATVNAASGIVRGTQLGLASLPTPGSILLPLGILLVFFFLLLPVNGHTRLVWLWLVLTGNAEIQQQSGSTSNSGGSTSTPTATTTPSSSSSNGSSSNNPVTNPLGSNILSNLTPILTISSWVEDIL